MRKWVPIIIKTIIFLAVFYAVMMGTIYLKLTTRSERELWRITKYTVSNPVVVNDLIIFNGFKTDRSVDCYCLYAVDKSTGKIVWSTEDLALPYSGFAPSSSISFSVYTSLELASQTGDFIYVSLNYWNSYDTIEQVLFAIRSNDGKMLWKVDGAIDRDSFSNSISQINQIYVVDNQGDMLAIDSNTGEEIWQRKVYQNYDEDYTWFRYHSNMVLVSTHSSECLKCCCTFISDEQQYEQIAAFSAKTGQPLWETARLDSGRIYVFNDTLYMVSRPWEKSSDVDKMDDDLVTAIDLKTGKKRQDLIFEDAHEFSVTANSQNETFFFIRTYEGGPDNFHELAKLIIVDEFTSKPIWQFNENFSHGDFGYLINDNAVYIGTEDGFIYLLDSKTGNVIWQTKTEDFPFHFVVEGNNLIVVYKKSFVSVLDARTGLQKWKLNLGVAESWSIFGDEILRNNSNTIFVAGNSSPTVYAVDIDTGKQLWSWSHFRPADSEYQIGLIDNDTIYVNQQQSYGSFFDALIPDYFDFDDWTFVLKTEP